MLTRNFFPFLCRALFLPGYLRYYTALSKFVQFFEDRVRLLECSPASCLAPPNHCEEKHEKLTSHRLPTSVLAHATSTSTSTLLYLAGTVSNFKKPLKAYLFTFG